MYVKSLIGIVFGVASIASAAEAYNQNINTCVNIHEVLKVPQRLIPGKKFDVGFIDACLCLDGVNAFVSSNPVTIAGVGFAGKSSVVSAITSIIKSKGQVCHYPDHAVATCTRGNPCKFDCKDGYQPVPKNNPTQCVCHQPYMECNGKCGIFQGCPSGRPHYRRARSHLCPEGMRACETLGRGEKSSWECIDTMNTLESCGGCVFPLAGERAEGVDCSELEGAVGCVEGHCVTE